MSVKLEILATPLDRPNFCRFTIAGVQLSASEIIFDSCPNEDFFVRSLFQMVGLSQVIVDQNYIICQKTDKNNWQDIGKTIGNVLRLCHQKNTLHVPESYQLNKTDEHDSDDVVNALENKEFQQSNLGKRIQETVDLQIQPSLGAHGGSVKLLNLQDGNLYVSFSGGCQGCSQASVTVREGIEKIIKAKYHEVLAVVDVTNHSSGQTPYFK